MKSQSNRKNGLSIIVPVLNEAENIGVLIDRIDKSLAKTDYDYEIIVIDDHSTDNTKLVVQNKRKKYPVLYFEKLGQVGKAQSLLEGFTYAKYQLLCMIDSDLQYPPEVIPSMLEEIDNGYDVVLTNRAEVHTNLVRKVFSKSFNYVFCRLLHNLPYDVQSGLKIFKKEIIERIKLNPYPWTFDLEFLTSAYAGGYKITSKDIVFNTRAKGNSKINIFKASSQIGLSAILLKLKPHNLIPFHKDKQKIVGQGFHYKRTEFIHYSDLAFHESAVKVFFPNQIIFIFSAILLFALGFILNSEKTITAFVAVITIVYFCDLLFNLFLIYRSLVLSPEISISDEELSTPREWPMYTIFCPLYKEWHVVSHFVKSIEQLDYPKDKLQVQLLLEEDDRTTIDYVKKVNLPSYFEVIVVPHSLPKTKPKACNYGLRFAKGEFAVIYDAEDMPDPLQLKKAYLGFCKAKSSVACIQAKLNYYNRSQNLLTRLFTAEYSLWFDLILTGLQSLNAPIPLGGTSNHFKVAKLREVKGWDSFNVTEDCDLGIRLAKKGYTTAIIDSDTLEEANSDVMNWINQRSRWIKGYMQTYLVHMRNPLDFIKSHNRAHFFTFQLVVGGKILSLFINPFMWVTTIVYFALRAIVGPTIERFFPGIVLYLAVFSLVFGNFLYMYYYMIGCVKRNQYDLVKFVFIIPLYWLGMSIASWKALFQLIFKPHYWQKTKHGLHLKENTEYSQVQYLSDIPQQFEGTNVSLKIRKLFYSGGILVIAGIAGNILNYLFNSFLIRKIQLEEYGLMSVLGNLLFLALIPLEAISSSIIYRCAYYLGKFNKSLTGFWMNTRRSAFIVGTGASIIWIILTPFLASFFHTDTLSFYAFAPVWLFNTLLAVDMGYITGNQRFNIIAVLILFTPLIKTILAVLFVETGYETLVFLSIPISIILSSIIAYTSVLLIPREKFNEYDNARLLTFPKKHFWITFITRFSLVSYLTLDILLVKHFLSPQIAGEYALLSIAGKMIFFLGGLFHQFIVPYVSLESKKNEKLNPSFKIVLFTAVMSSWMGYLFVGLFGQFTAPILFGNAMNDVSNYLPYYGFGVFAFSITSSIISYHIVRKSYIPAFASFILAIVQLEALILFHNNITQIVEVMTTVGILNLVTVLVLHIFNSAITSIVNNVVDFLLLLLPIPQRKRVDKNKLRILIYNWRDTRHIWSGGAEEYVFSIARQLVKKGHSITIFCGNDNHSPRFEEIDGVQIVRRGGFYTVYIWAFIYHVLRFRGKFDVIIDSINGVPFFTPLYARIPIVGVIHHVHQEVFREHLRWPLSTIACFLEAQMMPIVYRHRKMITVSDSTKENMKRIGFSDQKSIDIIHPGLDPDEFKPIVKTEHPSILYLGRLKKYKSIHYLLEAMPDILKEFPNTRLNIAGFGEYANDLQMYSKELGLNGQVVFTGKIPDKRKPRLMGESWVFVNPSFMEGWGITAIEASAAGTPVIASNVPGLRDSVQNGKTGMLVRYGDVNELTQAIITILKDAQLRKKYERNSVTWAKNFSWEKSANEMISVLNSII